ncbi:MAG: hypothetical protein Q9202_007630 [Teloschistes flavicans]
MVGNKHPAQSIAPIAIHVSKATVDFAPWVRVREPTDSCPSSIDDSELARSKGYPPKLNLSSLMDIRLYLTMEHRSFDWTSKARILRGFVFLYCTYYVLRGIYRIFFHPLAKYPGSYLAALSTEWYEWYWNIHKPGQLLFEIERLHQQYGPVIRIGVNELHIDSPNYFQEITKVGSRFYKEPNFYRGISYPSSSIGLVDPIAHRIRRQVLHPIFTASRVQTIAHKLQSKVEHLCRKFDESVSEDAPVNLYAAFKSLTMDIVSEMIFGESFHVIDSPGFQHPHLDALHDAVKKAWVFRTFPKLGWLSLNLPDLVSSTLFPIPIIELGKVCRKRIDQYLDNRSKPSKESRSEILEQLLDPNAARGHSIPNAYDLNEEALTLLTAGNDTTANSMIIGAYLICTHPLVLERLVAELDTAFPAGEGSITFEKAKQLPYLTAVLREVLRCSNPLPGRLPRVVPPEGASVDGIDLAPGVIVHTSAYLLNRHRSVWGPDGRDFNPHRWLSGQHQRLEKHMASFYRGARQCLGMHLAWCELYLLIATMFRKYDVEVFNTTPEDMAWTDHLLML